MAKMKEIDVNLRKKIVTCHQMKSLGYKKLSTKFDVPVSTVRAIIKRYQASGSVTSASRSGRPKKMTPVTLRRCLRLVKRDPRMTTRDLCKALEDSGV